MGERDRPDVGIRGQMDLDDLFKPPERLVAVSRIFARARQNMSLAEQKTFIYALSQINFKDQATSNVVLLEKKTLANILGLQTDTNHLSNELRIRIRELPIHSYIEIAKEDADFFDSGTIITRLTLFRNYIRIKFEPDYLSLFTGLSTNYITLWSSDIFKLESVRSVQFYEHLRQFTDSRNQTNTILLGVKALKELFGIPKDGKGSYMKSDGHFNRTEFEKKIVQPLCDDLTKCQMIKLLILPDGKAYQKVKVGSRVAGYKFFWEYHDGREIENEKKSASVPTPHEQEQKQKPKTVKRTGFSNFEERVYDFSDVETEKKFLTTNDSKALSMPL